MQGDDRRRRRRRRGVYAWYTATNATSSPTILE